jgi:hypothetical protein
MAHTKLENATQLEASSRVHARRLPAAEFASLLQRIDKTV